MSYPRRPLICRGTYFVSTRCINRESMLSRSELKDVVLSCISKAQEKYSFELSAFGVVDDQVKLTIRTLNPHDTISRIMQHIKSNATRLVNRKTFRTGTMWNERFTSIVVLCIEETRDFIRKSILLTSGILKDGLFIPYPDPYGSFSAHTGKPPGKPMVTVHEVFRHLSRLKEGMETILKDFGWV